MPSPEIEEFAKILVQQIRDPAIQAADADPRLGAAVIPDIVDAAVFQLLDAIDNGALSLMFVTSKGRKIDLATEGKHEMSGWYIGNDGWRSQYAQERYVDYASPVAPEIFDDDDDDDDDEDWGDDDDDDDDDE